MVVALAEVALVLFAVRLVSKVALFAIMPVEFVEFCALAYKIKLACNKTKRRKPAGKRKRESSCIDHYGIYLHKPVQLRPGKAYRLIIKSVSV